MTWLKFDSRSGFSLIELLMVIAIMGILATVAIPTFGEFLNEFRLGRATNSVLTAFHAARLNAIKYARVIRARVNLDDELIQFEKCTVLPPDVCPDDGDWVAFSEMQTITVPETIDIYSVYNIGNSGDSAKSGVVNIEFLPSGTKPFNAVLLTWKPNPDSSEACNYRTLYLSSTGEARRVEYNGAGYGAYSSPFDSYKLSGSDDASTKVPDCAR